MLESLYASSYVNIFFFFQAEDGIRDSSVTGVQTCALPISIGREGQEIFVEVSHEALIREWPALREWLAQNREELRLERRLLLAAEEWQGRDHDPGGLHTVARPAQAQEWLDRQL